MTSAALGRAAEEALTAIGPDALCALAEGIAAGRSRTDLLTSRAVPGFTEAATAILDALPAGDPAAGASYLQGLAAGYRLRSREQEVSLVWSGPTSHRVPVRSTAQVLGQVISEARSELLLMTYSATRYAPLTQALHAATARGVTVDIVVETLQGAGSALSGAEPASAFAEVAGARIWHWPSGGRAEPGAKTHAKLAVADRRSLFTTSANFTHSGADRNIEAGVLIKGGAAPARAAEHIKELQRTGILQRYW
ncbi:DISARM system phospholipase D-like protein DrmC [Streptomyces sp. NPDC048629]|uniref:DISARM system phospholipase D-like protein DrmC n=1 Tax=Streptomyces sp. NPDC048629 TaxID=3154824 RepID=UPI003443D198